MLIRNAHPDYGSDLDARDSGCFGNHAVSDVTTYLRYRPDHLPTPLHALPALASDLGVAAIHVKDEGSRLGLGSFKALGGAYAVIRVVLEKASEALGRNVGYDEMSSLDVKQIASAFTVACATDGNHGRSVAQGARLIGARCVIFVHSGVSDERVAAIARFGAELIRVDGTYDDSVVEATRSANEHDWITISDTSWPGYERVPGLVMQGYTALMYEAREELPERPTHVFIQAGVGGLAAAVAGYLAAAYGDQRPTFVVVEPDRAACLYESARAGHSVKIAHGAPTVMAMLECYEPSLIAWRVLSRVADAFMTIGETDAIAAMNRLARRSAPDPAIVAGESGGVGLAGLLVAAGNESIRAMINLSQDARVFVINTEGATDISRYLALISADPAEVSTECSVATGD